MGTTYSSSIYHEGDRHDRYQIVHEHKAGRIIAEDTGLGFTRTNGVVIIQVTEQGRDDDQKQALYDALARRLGADAGVAPNDLVVSVVENTKADWTFGFGRAQFLTGEL